jgi:ribokinase
LGVSRVVLTMGAAGLIAGEGADIRQVEAFEVEAVDTTAAGDIFCGALAVGLGEGRSFWEALRFASAASALSVTRFGAQPSAPHRQEIEEFLRERAE